jgi:GT2 family glycosyltransferase
MPINTPAVSVILSVWNSALYLHHCLECLAAQTFKDFEIILVDNGSVDDGLDGVEKHWPMLRMRMERLDKNWGFAAANNIGAQLAKGQWLALLNSDAFPEDNWLEKLLEAAGNNDNFSFFTSRQIQADSPDLLDGAGDAYHISGLAWHNYAGWPAAQFGLEAAEVFSACAAAALYSREEFLQAGGLDEHFFSYHEDVDLGFRLRLQGYRCLYVPEAVVYHIGSASFGTRSDFAIYHWQRNFIWSFIQNMPSSLVWEALPSHLLANFIYILNYSLRGRGNVIWQAKRDALKDLSRVLKKRQDIQKNSKVNRMDLARIMEHGPLQPYLLGYHMRKIKRTTKFNT